MTAEPLCEKASKMRLVDYPGYAENAETIAPDDAECFGLLEVYLQVPRSDDKTKYAIHRVQVIDFRDGSQRRKQFRDLNDEKLWSTLYEGLPLQIPTLLQEKVGYVKMLADEARERGRQRSAQLRFRAAESTLIQDVVTRAEIVQKVLKRSSHFGASRTAGKQR